MAFSCSRLKGETYTIGTFSLFSLSFLFHDLLCIIFLPSHLFSVINVFSHAFSPLQLLALLSVLSSFHELETANYEL